MGCLTGRSLGRAVARHLDRLRHAGRAQSTLESLSRILRRFVSFLTKRGVDHPSQIERRHLEAWVDHLVRDYRIPLGARRGHRLHPGTTYAWTLMVLGFLGDLVRTRRLVADPRAGFEKPRPQKSRRRYIPTEAEVSRFLGGIDPTTLTGLRDRALLEMAYSTGLRAGELSRLDLYDIDLSDGRLRVRFGKGGFDREVPMGRCALRWLNEYLSEVRPEWVSRQSGDALFLSKRRSRLAPGSVSLQCRVWARLARLPMLTPHSLRHAAATHMLVRGADIRHIQVFLGHQEITTTNLYTHLEPVDLVRAHRRSHPRG